MIVRMSIRMRMDASALFSSNLLVIVDRGVIIDFEHNGAMPNHVPK